MNLYNALQTNFTKDGYLIPHVSAADLALIQNQYSPFLGKNLPNTLSDDTGKIAFNTDTNLFNQLYIETDSNNNVFIAEWVPIGVMIYSNGNPNGNQAGIRGWSCYDYTNNKLYFCTTSGAKTATSVLTAAVWTQL